MKTIDQSKMGDLVHRIGKLAVATQKLAQQAVMLYSEEVEDILKVQDHDSQGIERCLDGMLGFCFDDSMLALYKKLCRYYYEFNPEVTIEHIYTYREIWDDSNKGL